jgi:hypothetical protein
VSAYLHIVLDGTAAAPYEAAWCRSNRESIQNQHSLRHRSQRSVLLRVLGRMCGHDRMGGRCRTNGAPSRLALCATGSAGFSALTVLRWPGSLLPCDHGLLCAVALTLQGKREVGARQRDVAWTSAVQWIGQACHSGTMASSQKSQPRHAPGGALFDDLYDDVAAPARPGRRRAKRASVILTVTAGRRETHCNFNRG